MNYKISHPTRIIECEINLPASKSISNRLLIIQALSKDNFRINNLSNSDDTVYLKEALKNKSRNIFSGAGGTTFRFLLSYLATKTGEEVILNGTNRIKERPIKELINVLRTLGADIDCLGGGYLPPLRIKGKNIIGGKVSIDGDISSQFISSLLMIAPTLKEGLRLKIKGEIVSKSYIQMTLKIMKEYGITYSWKGNVIKISPQKYLPKKFDVESDWSAASFWFEIAALSDKCRIILNGIYKNSLQGDSNVINLFSYLGVIADFRDNSVILRKEEDVNNIDKIDLINTPDLYQPLRCTSFALNKNIKFTGIHTLKNKETDRILSLKSELKKINISNIFKTYNDHRMAMSLAPLSLKFGPLQINNVEVVSKSYPNYWKDLKKGGFIINPSTC